MLRIAIACCVLSSIFIWPVLAQDGHHGMGHAQYHDDFYLGLQRNGFSCCNLADCRPTQSRETPQGYEVKVDGDWVVVPYDTILKKAAPDGGAHVCAPKQQGEMKGKVYCVVLPPET